MEERLVLLQCGRGCTDDMEDRETFGQRASDTADSQLWVVIGSCRVVVAHHKAESSPTPKVVIKTARLPLTRA